MKLPEIVGVSGTNGAGKDVLCELLVERYGYHFHSVSDLLRDELRRQGKELNRENMGALSKQWRNETGDDGVMFTKAIEKFHAEKNEKGYKGAALVSVRHPGEVASIHASGGVTIWVDADRRVRYERIASGTRGRAEDMVSFEQFAADEDREMNPPADAPAGTLNMAAVRDIADIHIDNNFASLEEYKEYLIKEFEL